MSTRLFFVTDSDWDNEEIHETLEQARTYLSELQDPSTGRIRICTVRNAFLEEHSSGKWEWNYDDLNNTFTTIKEL